VHRGDYLRFKLPNVMAVNSFEIKFTKVNVHQRSFVVLFSSLHIRVHGNMAKGGIALSDAA